MNLKCENANGLRLAPSNCRLVWGRGSPPPFECDPAVSANGGGLPRSKTLSRPDWPLARGRALRMSATLLAAIFFLSTRAPAQEPAAASLAGPEGLLDLQAVEREVLAVNPALKAARAKWEAMKQRIPQARAWEDLQAGMDAENGGDNTEWMLMQAIPLSGKNRLAGSAIMAEVAAMQAEVRRRELDLASAARVVYHALANAREQLRINEENVELLRQFVTISRAKYEVGRASQSDVLLAETELAKLEEARFDIERQISDALSQLNALLNRPAQSPLPKPARPVVPPAGFDLLKLQRVALAHRPEVRAAEHRIAAADARVTLAKREWIPDPEIRTEIRHFIGGEASGMVEYDAGIVIKVPWLNRKKYEAKIKEARHEADAMRHEWESLQTETLRLVRDQLQKIETFHHHTILFRDKIVPLARQNVSAARLAYETDKGGFLALIDAQRTLQEVEGVFWHHLTEYVTALAELEAILGTDPWKPDEIPSDTKLDASRSGAAKPVSPAAERKKP